MKGSGKIILGVAVLTACLLVYVHEQITLFQISYTLNAKSQTLVDKRETFQRLKLEVNQLRAPDRLEAKIEELALNLALPQEIQIVRTPSMMPLASAAVQNVSVDPYTNRFFNLLGRWIDVAQAKTDA